MTYAIGAAIAAVVFGAVWLVQRLFREPNGDGWKERSAHETGRADGAEEALDRFDTLATARQEALEKELSEQAQNRIDRGDPGARGRVLSRWHQAAERARTTSGEIDRPASVRDAEGAAAGTDPAVDPERRN